MKKLLLALLLSLIPLPASACNGRSIAIVLIPLILIPFAVLSAWAVSTYVRRVQRERLAAAMRGVCLAEAPQVQKSHVASLIFAAFLVGTLLISPAVMAVLFYIYSSFKF